METLVNQHQFSLSVWYLDKAPAAEFIYPVPGGMLAEKRHPSAQLARAVQINEVDTKVC